MLQKLLILTTGLLLTAHSFAAGEDFCAEARKKPAYCNYKDLSDSQQINSMQLTDLVGEKLIELEKSEKAQGRDLKVVILARQGSNLDKLAVIKDYVGGKKPTYRSIDELAKLLEPSPFRDSEGGTPNPYQQLLQEQNKSLKLKYSHVGIAVKNHPDSDKENGYWEVFQLLWACENNYSSVHENGMGFFFMDHMAAYGAQILIPASDMQDRLEQLLLDKDNRANLTSFALQKNYNAAARWNDLNEQNSNQWVLEVMGMAQYPVGQIKTRAQAQQALMATNYHPTIVIPTGLYSLINFPGVSNFLPSTICFKNQKYVSQYGMAEIVSALSVEQYLKTNKQLLGEYEVQVAPEDMIKETQASKSNK